MRARACQEVDGEDIDALYAALRLACTTEGPIAIVCKRKMCPGVKGVEGTCHGHDAIALAKALTYLEDRKLTDAIAWLNGPAKQATKDPQAEYLGTKGSPLNANRAIFGEAVRCTFDCRACWGWISCCCTVPPRMASLGPVQADGFPACRTVPPCVACLVGSRSCHGAR